ncbi:MAG: hypothetical protein GKR95_17960 [Gammaproteobacteria bacterium]|nr:hypothetical protein [Gammaproteobacteria bacterium]
MALSWVLHTLKQVAVESEIETIAIIGTTALGGQGANLVWTHQSSQEMDSGLVSKIFAAYGILGVLDRVNWEVDLQTRWILLTPGSLLGYDYVSSGIVNYFSIPGNLPDAVQATVQENHGKVPLYKPIEICLASLSDEKVDWATRKLQDSFLSGVRIKCGETGDLSPLQFACISHASQMGFNTDSYVAKVLVTELMGRNTGYNQIPLGSGKILEPTAQGHDEREFALQRTAQLELETKRRSPSVYPALGSPRTQKEIVLADLVYRLLTEKYGDPTIQQLCDYDSVLLSDDLWKLLENDSLLLAEVTAVIPVITPTGKLYTGPSIMYLERSITRSLDLFSLTNEDQLQQFAALGAVDLRPHQFDIEHRSKTYKTGTGVLINRARYIVKNYLNALQPHTIDNCGSGIDSRIRSWSALTKDGCTTFDPVRFTVHFLGGERPFIW